MQVFPVICVVHYGLDVFEWCNFWAFPKLPQSNALFLCYKMYPIYRHVSFRRMLLLLLSRFSHVRLSATPLTAAHQALRSLGFSSKNTGLGCHFLLQCMKVKSESEVSHPCPTLSNPMDFSLPSSSIPGIFQARGLEWGAIVFSLYKAVVLKVQFLDKQHQQHLGIF